MKPHPLKVGYLSVPVAGKSKLIPDFFNRKWMGLTTSHDCWICLFPIGGKHADSELLRSKDHIIPAIFGGRRVGNEDNIKYAHRWCNSKRGLAPLDKQLILSCRRHMLDRHIAFLKRVGVFADDLEINSARVRRLFRECAA